MANQLAIIEQKLTSTEVTNRLVTTLGIEPNDERATQQAFRYASSVLAEVKKTQGQEKGDLTLCTPDSICQAMIDAAQFKIAIDGRKLAYMEARYSKAVNGMVAGLQITTNGFVAKIKEFHADFTPSIVPVFKGDEVMIGGDENQKTFHHKSSNPFGGVADLTGIVVIIKYGNVVDVQPISKADLDMIRSKGKSTAWNDFSLERMKTAALKRACKWHFRQNATIQAIVDYDNTQNFDLSQQPAAPVRKSIVDNINQSIASPPGNAEPEQEKVIEGDFVQLTEPEHGIIAAARVAAAQGVKEYTEYRDSLPEADKDLVRPYNKEFSQIARAADNAKNPSDEEPSV